MCRLTKSYGQYKSVSSPIMESELCIQVGYDHTTNEVTDDEVKVWSHNFEKNVDTDLTAVFNETLSHQLESMIKAVDWNEVYRETKADKRAA